MIKIFRQDKTSVHIEFDEEGSGNFLKMFNEIYKHKEYELRVDIDMGVIKMRKGEMKRNSLVLCNKNNEEESVMTIQNDIVVWKISLDDIEMGVDKFTDCEQQGYFFPSEFIRMRIPKNKKLDYTYCKLVHGLGD